jgi:putative addiction module component (TIGR02574 family)
MYATELNNIYKNILIMKPIEKIKLIDELILSLDIPNSIIEEEWNIEVEKRVDGYRQNKIKTVSTEEVFAKYEI